MDILKRHYGGAVSGDYFWPRPAVTAPMLATLVAGESIKCFGLRRTGKSSVLLELERELRALGKTPVYVDVQGTGRVDILLAKLLRALPTDGSIAKLTNSLSAKLGPVADFVASLRAGKALETISPRAALHMAELFTGDLTPILAKHRGSTVLIIDELPFLVQNMLEGGIKAAEINGFLATLRSWRRDGGLPMVLTGSMGLSWLGREHGIGRDLFSDPVHYDAPPPLGQAEAVAMMRALERGAQTARLSDPMIAAAVAESGAAYPSFLQYAFGRLHDHRAGSVDDVRRIFQDHIRPGLHQDFYDQFDTRLARYGRDKVAARSVLRAVAKASPIPLESASLAFEADDCDPDDLLLSLREDGFLTADTHTGTIAFTSPFVRIWWNAKPYRR